MEYYGDEEDFGDFSGHPRFIQVQMCERARLLRYYAEDENFAETGKNCFTYKVKYHEAAEPFTIDIEWPLAYPQNPPKVGLIPPYEHDVMEQYMKKMRTEMKKYLSEPSEIDYTHRVIQYVTRYATEFYIQTCRENEVDPDEYARDKGIRWIAIGCIIA